VGHREQDFDTGAHLADICLYVTVFLLPFHRLDPKSSVGIYAHLSRKKDRLVILSVFLPGNKSDNIG